MFSIFLFQNKAFCIFSLPGVLWAIPPTYLKVERNDKHHRAYKALRHSFVMYDIVIRSY